MGCDYTQGVLSFFNVMTGRKFLVDRSLGASTFSMKQGWNAILDIDRACSRITNFLKDAHLTIVPSVLYPSSVEEPDERLLPLPRMGYVGTLLEKYSTQSSFKEMVKRDPIPRKPLSPETMSLSPLPSPSLPLENTVSFHTSYCQEREKIIEQFSATPVSEEDWKAIVGFSATCAGLCFGVTIPL